MFDKSTLTPSHTSPRNYATGLASFLLRPPYPPYFACRFSPPWLSRNAISCHSTARRCSLVLAPLTLTLCSNQTTWSRGRGEFFF